jgi:hypothetical protein
MMSFYLKVGTGDTKIPINLAARIDDMRVGDTSAGGSCMKTRTHRALTISLCSFIVVLLFACGSNEGGNISNVNSMNPIESSSAHSDANSQTQLAGTWVSGEYSLTFKPDCTYLRGDHHEDLPAVWGSVLVSGNLIILTDTNGGHPCIDSDGQVVSGSYTFAISGDTLTLSIFHDPCSERVAALKAAYTKQ